METIHRWLWSGISSGRTVADPSAAYQKVAIGSERGVRCTAGHLDSTEVKPEATSPQAGTTGTRKVYQTGREATNERACACRFRYDARSREALLRRAQDSDVRREIPHRHGLHDAPRLP
jgi:hypothetical protein